MWLWGGGAAGLAKVKGVVPRVGVGTYDRHNDDKKVLRARMRIASASRREAWRGGGSSGNRQGNRIAL